jgi:hypothetical protein
VSAAADGAGASEGRREEGEGGTAAALIVMRRSDQGARSKHRHRRRHRRGLADGCSSSGVSGGAEGALWTTTVLRIWVDWSVGRSCRAGG